MLPITNKLLFDNARKSNLIYWQVTDGGNEIQRQEDDINIEDSLELLEDLIKELKEIARSGDKIKISMQNIQMSSSGKKKGTICKNYFIYLREPEARNMQGISNLSLVEENIRLKMEMQHEKEKSEWIKRIEALENQEEEKSTFDKTIEGIEKLVSNPAAQLLLGMILNGKGTTAPAPAINGVPVQDYSELLERIEKIDSEFITMLNAIVIKAEKSPEGYFGYKNLLLIS